MDILLRGRPHARTRGLGAGAGLLLALLASGPSTAAIITVTTDLDSFGTSTTNCSLREAVQAANTNTPFGGCTAGSVATTDVIQLPPRRYLLELGDLDENSNAEGDLDIFSDMVINGTSGAANTSIVSGGAQDRLFDMASSSSVLTVAGVTLRGGNVSGSTINPDGGAIRRGAGVLRVVRSAVTGGIARLGGGIHSNGSNGQMEIIESTLSGNTATSSGGGLYTAGSVVAQLTNVTISGNYSDVAGGGIAAAGNLDMTSSTVAFNRCDCGTSGGGGLAFTGPPANGSSVVFNNSLFSDNSDGTGGVNSDIGCAAATLQGGEFNLIRRSTCALTVTSGNTSGDPRLTPLFDFGRGVPTHALIAGSAALNTGAPSSDDLACPATDARGVFRQPACDIGAYEQVPDFIVNTVNDVVDANVGDGLCRTAANQCSLRAAIQEANESEGRHVIQLPSGNYILSLAGSGNAGGDLDVRPVTQGSARQIAIFGSGADSTRITSSGLDRVFDVHGDLDNDARFWTSFALVRLEVRGGRVVAATNGEAYGGGIHVSNAALLMVDSIVSDNRIDNGSGGGIALVDERFAGDPFDRDQRGSTTLERVAVLDNRASSTPGNNPNFRGGGIHVDGGDLVATNVTISQNHADNGGGLSVDASSFSLAYGTARLTHVTIAENRVPRFGGGMYLTSTTVYARNSIVANNGFEPGTGLGAPDCYAAPLRPLVSLGYNVLGVATDCSIAGDVVTNETGVDARLSPLDQPFNGLPTHFLYTGSPALNLVPQLLCSDAGLIRVWHDQNRAARPAAGSTSCDAGASEGSIAAPPDGIFDDGFEDA